MFLRTGINLLHNYLNSLLKEMVGLMRVVNLKQENVLQE